MEATKEKAKQYIFDLFPCLLVLFIGEENVQHAISQLIAAIQCQRLNRHFLFCLLDTIFLHLFPEVKSTDFQQMYEPNNVGSSFSSDDFMLSSLNS
ncbi:sorting nexin-25-like [Octopus bimaculoides]|nr:sorting nexin-25-like [Octopus bimaculoides]